MAGRDNSVRNHCSWFIFYACIKNLIFVNLFADRELVANLFWGPSGLTIDIRVLYYRYVSGIYYGT